MTSLLRARVQDDGDGWRRLVGADGRAVAYYPPGLRHDADGDCAALNARYDALREAAPAILASGAAGLGWPVDPDPGVRASVSREQDTQGASRV